MTMTQLQPQLGSTNHRAQSRATQIVIALAGLMFLSGCATSKDELMPTNGMTMQQIWEEGSRETSNGGAVSGSAGQRAIEVARESLRRPIDASAMNAERTLYTREAANEIKSQFTRLPNPDLVIFIYPHLTGDQTIPVPGYSTVFPLYERPHYAMPGESARPEGRTR